MARLLVSHPSVTGVKFKFAPFVSDDPNTHVQPLTVAARDATREPTATERLDAEHSVMRLGRKVARLIHARSKHDPHQGKAEMARRRRQRGMVSEFEPRRRAA